MRRARHSAVRAGACAALASLLFLCGGCDDGTTFATAYRATSPDQLIGGDVAMARVGDFIMENDQIRVAILDRDSSPAPGVFGGTLVDADLKRPEAEFRNGHGADQLAEVFPFANLLFPRPDTGDVEIVSDGSDGGPAVIQVRGTSGLFLEALSLLQNPLVQALFAGAKLELSFSTDYILEPGKRYVRMVSRATWTASPDPVTDPLALPPTTGPTPVFTAALGSAADGLAPGIVAGDFVFFGGRNDIFGPGIGYDEEKPVFDALFQGRDTFTYPLDFDFVAASGGPVSYGYFTANPGGPDPRVLIPIITSSSTAFISHAMNCSTADTDDASCDRFNSWTWERFLAVGDGDVASIGDIVYEARGTAVGTLRGVVMGDNGQPWAKGKVFVFRDPDPAVTFADPAAIAEANARDPDVGSPGVLTVIEADPGMDRHQNGAFSASLPPGTYLVVAQNEGQTSTSVPFRVTIATGEATVVAPVVPPPARVRYRVTDGQGRLIEAKLSFVSRLPDGSLAERDGLRRPYMGEGRLGNGVRHMVPTISGEGVADIAPGSYRVFVSHGPEFSRHEQEITVAAGQEASVHATLIHEVDTKGWIAGDFHLHSEGSFDSGMPYEERVRRCLIEGLDLAVATDHDIVTDYRPAVRALGVEDRIKTGIGVELSTLELGHFIGFPLNYDHSIIPHHGAPDWTCLDGEGVAAELASKMVEGERGVRIIAHPRDGFIGHISQVGSNPWDFGRDLSLLEQNNVLLAQTTCEFDAVEVFNSKRFDLVRTPTNREVILFNRCTGELDAATDHAALDAACPEISGGMPLATCAPGLRFFECKQRYRRRMAFLMARDILIRTPEEQLAFWDHIPSGDDEDFCSPGANPGDIDPVTGTQPCTIWVGTYDEWMKWTSAGLEVTLTGASDSHGNHREPGFPRTLVKSAAPTPSAIDVGEVAGAIVDGHALPTFGPVIEATIAGAGPGEVVSVSGDTFSLDLRVQTASWYGVDRIEVYVNGLLEHIEELNHGPEPIIDFEGAITLPVPGRDGFVTVTALGWREENLFGPVSYDVNFGELQLPRIVSLAFGSIPAVSALFTTDPAVPDFFPVFPMAITNAIRLDTDGDAAWIPSTAALPLCRRSCDPTATNANDACEAGETCLPIGSCGIAIDKDCQTGPPGSEARQPDLGLGG